MWKDIKGYEGIYQIDEYGTVKSLQRTRIGKAGSTVIVPERILKQKTDKDGYKEVTLSDNGKMKYFRVHRLVAEAFIPNPNAYPVINHLDENPANNHISNLEWCTCSYNTRYSIYKVSHKISCNGVEYPSIRECSRELNIDTNCIRYCLKTGKPYKGILTFKYL